MCGLHFRLGAVMALSAGLLLLSCQKRGSPPPSAPPPPDAEPASTPTPGLPWFEDVTGASGIDFRHYDSTTAMDYVQERMGSGLAWIDYDNDGWPDLFCVQDGPVFPKAGGPAPTNKLYRNNGDGT